MTETSLLPGNATPFEAAQSETDAARWPLPTHLIKDVWNPATCPLDLLPYLAAGLGLEIWHDDWPEAHKRAVTASIWQLKRNKTKLKGIAAYLALENATLVGARRPRDKRWWNGSQTAAQRAAMIAAMPQIHIAVAPSPTTGVKQFWGGRATRQAWSSRRYWTPSDAPARYAARATYVDKGVSTAITIVDTQGPYSTYQQVQVVAPALNGKMFWGARRFWGAAAFQTSDADDHVLTITPDPTATHFAIPAGLVPLTVAPVRVNETVPSRPGMRFWGSTDKAGLAWGGSYGVFRGSDANAHVFDQITLFDASRAAPGRQPYSFWGWSRWGRPAYTANLRVAISLTRPPLQQGWGRPWGRNFWRTSDMSPFWDAIAAARVSQAYRDTVWIDTQLYEAIAFTPGLRFGDANFKTFGAMKRLQ